MNRKIAFLSLAFFLVMGMTNVCYFLPLFYGRQGYSVGDAGTLVSAFYAVSLALRLFGGSLVPLLGFRKLFLLAGAAAVLGTFGMTRAGDSFWMAFCARAFLGAGSSLFQIGLATYQALAFPEKERGRAYSLVMAGCLLPMMTLVPLADWLLHSGGDGFYILIPLAAALGSAALLPFLPQADALRPPARAGSWNPFPPMLACLRLPVFRVNLFAFFLFCLADATASFMSGMTAARGLMASYFLSSNAVVGVGVRVFLAPLLDRYPRHALSAPAIVATGGMLLIASFASTPAALTIAGMVFGAGMGIGFPLHLALVSDGVPEELQPHAVAFSWFVMGLDFAMAPILLGWIGSAADPVSAFRILCAVVLIGAASTVWIRRKTPL